MLRRLVLLLMLLAGLALLPLARAGQPCCAQGCDAMPACAAVCSVCVSPSAALPAPEPMAPAAAPAGRGVLPADPAFDSWIDTIWTPPD